MRDTTEEVEHVSGHWRMDDSWRNDPRFSMEQPRPAPESLQITATPFKWRDPSTFPRRRFIYGRHLVRRYLSCTVAPPGLGKSSLELVEAVALTTGRNLLGKHCHEGPVRVWFICLEDPLEELERRVLAILMHYDIDPAELGDRLFLDSGRTVNVVLATTTRNGTEIAQPVVDALKAEILARRIDVLIVDPMVKAHRVSENDNMAIDAVCTAFAGIADETDCAIELVHHVKKGTGAEITVEDGRGASALLGAVRSARVLNPMSKDEADRVGGINARDFFRDTNGKANLAPPPDRSDWYRKASVSLGNGSGGLIDDSDHVGVVEPWQWPDMMAEVTVADLRKVQDVVAAGRWRENHQSKSWVGHAVAQVIGADPDVRADKARIVSCIKTWVGTGMLVIVEGEDEKRMKRSFVEVGELATP